MFEADGVIRGSWRHLATSTALFAGIFAFEIAMHAARGILVAVLAMYVFVVSYNLARISAARRARRSPEAARAFAEDQLESHRVRGRIYLVIAPILVLTTWIALLVTGAQMPRFAWLVLVAATGYLGFGWMMWRRVLRRIAT